MELLTPRPTPNLEDKLIIFFCANTFDLSDMGSPTSSYATASIAFKVI
jgi:hypothetical protein